MIFYRFPNDNINRSVIKEHCWMKYVRQWNWNKLGHKIYGNLCIECGKVKTNKNFRKQKNWEKIEWTQIYTKSTHEKQRTTLLDGVIKLKRKTKKNAWYALSQNFHLHEHSIFLVNSVFFPFLNLNLEYILKIDQSTHQPKFKHSHTHTHHSTIFHRQHKYSPK